MRGKSFRFAVVLLAAGVSGCSGQSSPQAKTVTVTAPNPETVTITATETSTYTPPPPPGPARSMQSEGTYVVGTDIVPGTYRSPGGTAGVNCYWERLSGLSGDASDRITNGLSEGPQLVAISPSDVAFETNNCLPWTLVE